jgi:N-acetyl-gamma-glutamyl-phosphate reductase
MSERMRVAVVGATGYGGAELVRLLAHHPRAEVTVATSSRSAGKPLNAECPWLASDLILSPLDTATLDADVVFLCQEAGFAMEHAGALAARMKVIDLSADFRLKDPQVYERTYGRPYVDPGVPPVYGLPELVDREDIRRASLIANPGCYPTASALGLAPLVREGLLAGVPVIDAKSGVSGAGRSRKESEYLFSELAGGFKAYGVTNHRHVPEIEQTLGIKVRFTPHLIPTPRGLQATIHAPLTRLEDLRTLYSDFYAGERFVDLRDTSPSIKQVLGSNRCAMSTAVDEHTGYAVICSVIDNLVKGAAGQAIQNMNLMMGLDEAEGLPMNGVWP